ncbi:MAG: hypothetical protein ABIT36_09185, partial [Steroidobacteraceae bacterium]
MRLRWPQWITASVLALVLLIVALLFWTINTTSGAHWTLQRVQGALGDKLALGSSSGTLAGPLELRDVRYRDAASGVDFTAARVRLDLRALALLRFVLRVESLDVQRVRLALREPTKREVDNQPFSLEPPFDILLEQLTLSDARVSRDGEPLVEVSTALLAATWTDGGIEVRQLDVQSPQGELHFAAQVNQREFFEGRGKGRFRWRAGGREYAGRFDADARGALAKLDLLLSAPVTATLEAELEQRPQFPWRFTLKLPEFDPRNGLLPDSNLRKLGAHLQGSGTATRGNTAGTIVLNDTTLQIESFGFAHEGEQLNVDALLKILGSRGQLQARGAVQLAREPVTARLNIDWRDVVIPADLVGQVLHSRGVLDFDGSPKAYLASGRITLGPPKRPADIQLRVAGSDSKIQISQLDIVQPAGRLAATGVLTLLPRLG